MNKFTIIVIIALLGMAIVLIDNKLSGKKQVVLNGTKATMTTKQMMYIVVFGALATVVGFFEIPIGFIGVKLDLSEVIILIAFYVIGFKNVSYVIVLRSIIRILLPSKTAAESDIFWKLLGEVIAIFASYLIITSYIVTKKICRVNEKPLIYAVPTEHKKIKRILYILGPILSALLLTIGMTIFHTIVTMPLYLSGNQHLTIFSLLRDPNYANQNILTIIKTILTMFGLVNVIKGVFSPLIFLTVKPQIEKIIM
ncbi:hypothetical protein [Haploplasma axanthum]|nr:hypothetical protein [Haploplasma axanthum]